MSINYELLLQENNTLKEKSYYFVLIYTFSHLKYPLFIQQH